ncbi:MAG: hypothetical protein LBI95_02910 [Holosporales bacterium]|nr:hypothetical protein [Holosporales bacterium]
MRRVSIALYVVFCLICGAFATEEVKSDAADVAISDSADSGENSSESSSSAVVDVSGFYGGLDLGTEFTGLKTHMSDSKVYNSKTKSGFLADVFTGYNVRFGRFILGLEGFIGLMTATPTINSDNKKFSLRKKYTFGIAPKIGCNIFNNISGYINFGALTTKYKARGLNERANPVKTSLFIGLGLERSFNDLFVRGEISRIFKKSVSKLNNVNLSTSSYTFKIGGGYRF